MKVADLSAALANREEFSFSSSLGDFTVNDDASLLTIRHDLNREASFYMDDATEKSLATFLKIPLPYLKSCPPEFKATTLRFWFDTKADAAAVVESINGELVSVHSPNHVMLPMREVVESISRVFDPADEARLLRDENRMHLDIVSDRYRIDVPNPDRVPGRPEVGDVTVGGVRVLAYPTRSKAPSVSTYLERLVCTNGMTTDYKLDEITLKGRSVDEVIEEMELAARRLLDGMPEKLQRYADTATMRVPGDPAAFAAQLARENNLPRAILDQALDYINQLPYATVYDINQAFTRVANTGVGYATMSRLQGLGGELALNAEHAVARCNSCERLL